MPDRHVLVPMSMFAALIAIAFGVPLVRALVRRMDRASAPAPASPGIAAQLERMERTLDAMSVEVERLAGHRRFTTRLLAGPSPEPAPAAEPWRSHAR